MMVLPSLAFLTVFVFIPAITAALESLRVRARDNLGNYSYSFGVQNYINAITDPVVRSDIVFTIVISIVCVALVSVLSYAIALALFVDSMLQQLGLPDGTFPRIVFDWKGIVITQVWLSLPFMTVLLTSVLQEISDTLVESARDVGATSWAIFRQIVLPLSLPGAAIGVTFIFLHVLGGFTVPYLLGPNAPQMLGVSMVAYMVNYYDRENASTQAMIIFLLSLVAAVYYVRQQFKREVR